MWFMRKRFRACGLVTSLSITTATYLLLSSPFGHLRQTRITQLHDVVTEKYRWDGRSVFRSDDIRVVVFGDSWVDNPGVFGKEKGKTWPEIFCDEINCTSRLTFAASQPVSDYLRSPPTGVYTSHSIHSSAHNRTTQDPIYTGFLPDLDAQISTYLAVSPPCHTASTTLFILSFGFWDIYSLASLNLNTSLAIVDQCVDEIFTQLDRIKSHLNLNTCATLSAESRTFRVILPKVLDPTLSPGWVRQKSLARSPVFQHSSIIKQQKNTVYLTDRWNQALENRVNITVHAPLATGLKTNAAHESRDYFFTPDFPQILVGLILEHYLKEEPFQDSVAQGPYGYPFQSVSEPCLDIQENVYTFVESGRYKSSQTKLKLCSHPDTLLWWDPWQVGAVGNAILGKELSTQVFENH
ncbi:hypothetical protein K3495_g8532 [Podosphaera aphanis]|nr:hypothetical protein K3495_g8532 [Podosphaera aphanis]